MTVPQRPREPRRVVVLILCGTRQTGMSHEQKGSWSYYTFFPESNFCSLGTLVFRIADHLDRPQEDQAIITHWIDGVGIRPKWWSALFDLVSGHSMSTLLTLHIKTMHSILKSEDRIIEAWVKTKVIQGDAEGNPIQPEVH
jgi:hypothetical protein